MGGLRLNNVKALRKCKGISQNEMARILGITNDYLCRIETGKQTPGLKLANKIAYFLDTTIDKLNFFETQSNKLFDQSIKEKMK